ncbi:MAG: multicopper oxidase domain-containing protein [Sulfolobales archaeon]
MGRLYVFAILLISILLVSSASIAFSLTQQPQPQSQDYQLPSTSYVPPGTKPTKRFVLELYRSKVVIGDGIVLDTFTINGTVPGPTIVVDEGDIVEIVAVNKDIVAHGLSIHAVYRSSSSYVGNVPPGGVKSIIFNASYPGVYMYHCAPGGQGIFIHTMSGQYGMIVVKPKSYKYRLEEILGRKPDIEIYLIQHEIYANGADFVNSKPLYVLFNGYIGRYLPGGLEGPIMARPGDYVRIYFLNVGPNLVSTLHLVGIVWDFAYYQGHPLNVIVGGQTVLAGPSDSWVVEFRVPEEGSYSIVSHVFSQPVRGAVGVLVAKKDANRTSIVDARGPRLPIPEKPIRVIDPFGLGSPEVDTPVYAEGIAYVRIIANSYYPKRLVIPEGTTVVWINEDIISLPNASGELVGLHDIVINMGNETVKSPLLKHGMSWSYTFTKAGVYRIGGAQLQVYKEFVPFITSDSDLYGYFCSLHPYMVGEIVVIPRTKPMAIQQASPEAIETPGVASNSAIASMAIAVVGVLLVVMLAMLAMIYRGRK